MPVRLCESHAAEKTENGITCGTTLENRKEASSLANGNILPAKNGEVHSKKCKATEGGYEKEATNGVEQGEYSTTEDESGAEKDTDTEIDSCDGLIVHLKKHCLIKSETEEWKTEACGNRSSKTIQERDKISASEDTFTKPHPSEETDNSEVSEIFIKDPEAENGEEKVSLGVHLSTVRGKYILHIFVDMTSGGLADQFRLKERDELLMVNSNGVIDKTHEEVLEMFASLKTTEPITLLKRRYLDLDSIEEDEKKKVIYIQTVGEILVEEEEEESNRQLLVKIQFTTSAVSGVIKHHSKNVRLRCLSPEGFLKFDGKRLLFKEHQADSTDDAYKFQVLHCKCIRDGMFVLVDIIKAYTQNFFLKVNDDDTVTMEERKVNKDGVPVKVDGVLLEPKGSEDQRQYQVYGEEKKYLAWDEEEGIRVDTVESRPIGQFLFMLADFKE